MNCPARKVDDVTDLHMPRAELATVSLARGQIPMLLVALSGVLLSALAWVVTATWVERTAAAEFETGASTKLAFLKEGFIDFEGLMRTFHGFIEGAAGRMDAGQLDQYAAPLIAQYPGTSALGWVPRVSRSERSNYEAQARRNGMSNYRIFQLTPSGQRVAAGGRDEYYPILHATPGEANRAIAGYDLGLDPQKWPLLEQARDSGELIVSGLQPLLIGGDGPGVIAVQAVYAGRIGPDSIEERRLNLIGFAVGVFRLSDMVNGTLKKLTQTIGVHTYVYRQGAAGNEFPVFIHTSLLAKTPAPALRLGAVEARRHVAGLLSFGTQSWLAVVTPMRQPPPALWRLQSLAAFGGCLVLASLATAYTYEAGRRRQQQRMRAHEVRESKERLLTIFNSVNDGIFLSDPATGTFVDVNNAGCETFGYRPGELLGRTIETLSSGIPPYTQSGAIETLARARSGGPQKFEWQAKRRDGSLFWVEISLRIASLGARPVGLAVVRDITERKCANEQITQMARHDLLTGLANRRVFVEALDQTIARVRRGAKSFAVLYLDLDHFKDVNDTLGHPVGDLLLQAVADRLRTSVRATDTLARFGGDEFAVIVSEIQDPTDAAVVYERIQGPSSEPVAIQGAAMTASAVADGILSALSEPFTIQGNEIRSGASVGIAVYGPGSADSETLLSHADEALYRAKSEERGSCRFFTDAMDSEVRTRVGMSRELHEAIASEQFFLLYQPQVEVDTGRIVGLEALVRWHHPTRGDLGPDKFIEAAEMNGLIVPLGRWVLREACRQTKQWSDAGIAPRSVAINLSGIQFKRPLELEGDIAAALAESALPAARLELELTESVLMQASSAHNDLLLRFRKQGMRIAIDDFGSGYSSLEYLRRYPVDRLKIAQSFIAEIGKESGSDAIVRAALGLARELGIEVVVEGAANAAQIALLKGWGCRIVQGFYFARPLPVAEVTKLLRKGRVPDRRAGAAAGRYAQGPVCDDHGCVRVAST